MFLDGNTPHTIAKALTYEEIPTPGGKKNWGATTVKSILSNEKYKGDALLQKSYTVDFLTKKKKANEGEIPQYYVEGSHQGIISTEVFELTQIEIERRKSGNNRHSGMGIFASKIKCGCCESWYGSKVWHSNSKYKRTIYQCNHKFKNGEKCTTPHLYEEQIQTAFITAVNKLISDKKRIIADFRDCEKVIFNMTEIENEREKLSSELSVTADLIQKIISENARIALDQTEYQKRYDGLVERFESTKLRLSEVEEQLSQKRSRKEIFRKFISDLEKQDGLISEFDSYLWCSLVDFVTVDKDGKLTFTFKNKVTIEV
jgi:hypothetical protein